MDTYHRLSLNFRKFAKPTRGRKPQNVDKIVFKECWPMVLKNQTSMKGDKKRGAECLKETLAFLSCLKDNNNSAEACKIQANAVEECYKHFLINKEALKKQKATASDFVPGKNIQDTGRIQLNRFLKHFPHKVKDH